MLQKLLNLFGARRTHQDVGAASETLAAKWLEANARFKVVTRNWRNPRDHREEIDLVCRDGDVLVFVEVKARAASALVPGYYTVDRRKKRVLLSACKAYLARLSQKPLTFRLDIVEVELPGSPDAQPIVRHFENVPLFAKWHR